MLSNRARLIVKTMVLTLLGAGATAAIVGLIVLRGGFYNISATESHYPLIYTVFEEGLQYSIQNHAEDIEVPALGAPEQLLRGATIYAANCVQCHGGPGVAPSKHGMSMQPVPGPLVDADINWETRELYWITRHGIKMSGMPAWEYHLSDSDIICGGGLRVGHAGDVAAGLQGHDGAGRGRAVGTGGRAGIGEGIGAHRPSGRSIMNRRYLPMLLTALALAGCGSDRPPPGVQGDPERGKIALTQYA